MKFRRWSVLQLVVIVALLSGSGCNLLDKLKAREHLNQGVSAYERKRYDDAAELFQQAVELDPELTLAQLYLATTYRAQFIPGIRSPENLEKARQAIQKFEELVESDPDNTKEMATTAMANIAMIYSGLDEHERAKEWYRKRAAIEPSNADPWYGIGITNWEMSFEKTGQTGEGVEELSEQERERLDQLVEEGVEALKKALEIQPDHTDAMQFLNLLYRELAKLSLEEDEKRRWTREADQLALQALELRREQEREAERARQKLFGAGSTKDKSR